MTYLQTLGKVKEVWVNGTMWYIHKQHWPSTQKNCQDLTQRYFLVFLRDEEFLSKTINDSNIDLNKYPASKVRQLAKQMESSKATAKHIKEVSHDPQATQIHLI